MNKKLSYAKVLGNENEEEELSFEEICNSFLSFITDIDLNIAMKEVFGVAPIEMASLIIKERGENKC